MTTRLSGAARLLEVSACEAATLEPGVVEQEQDDEISTYEDGLALDKLEAEYVVSADDDHNIEPLRDLPKSNKRRKLKDGVVQKASEGIIQPATRQEYARQWQNFTAFLQEQEFVDANGVEGLLGSIPSEFPEWICTWIMSRADPIDIYTGEECHPESTRVSYTVAQKMRAAITHKFGREFGLGPAPWAEDPLNPGTHTGNPSVSAVVSQYMISLRRRKIRGGEVVTSARAMNEDVMKQLYDYNTRVPLESLAPNPKKRKTEDASHWAGYQVRMMLHFLYVLSMLCLLRYDEALNIRWEDISIGLTTEGVYFIRLDLPFRKTHQFGDIIPFYLYLTPDKPHMCAVLAFVRWWRISGAMGIR
ncbi:hypothetical protein EIP86_002362 [Pleurotus ostreatoroseus]|nr:hypothetical protein EIP86_002362 [Pleurotus ostreatoroseus]